MLGIVGIVDLLGIVKRVVDCYRLAAAWLSKKTMREYHSSGYNNMSEKCILCQSLNNILAKMHTNV